MTDSSTVYEIGKVKARMFVAISVTLVIASLMLSLQNRKLKAELEVAIAKHIKAQEIQLGAKVPPFTGIDINGNKISLDYGQDRRKTVLMLFSPTCGTCREDVPKWQAVIKSLDYNSFRAVVASTGSTSAKEYAIENGLTSVPVIIEIAANSIIAYNLKLVPQIILISSDGEIEKVWTGELQGESLKDLKRTLGMQVDRQKHQAVQN